MAAVELVATIELAGRVRDFEIEIIDERRDRRRKAGRIGVSQRYFERLGAAGDGDALLEHLAVSEQH